MITPLVEIHRKANATMGTWMGCTLPECFNELEAEYAFADSVALLDTNYHAFAYLAGADRVRYLNAVASNNVKDLADGQGTVGLLLNAQGHILAEIASYALRDQLLVVSHAQVRQRTHETLEKFIIMDDATLTDVSDQLGSVAVEGPKTVPMLYQMCGLKLEAMPLHAHREVALGALECRVARTSYFGGMGAELIAERAALPALWQLMLAATEEHGGGPMGWGALNTLRLEAGVPWFGYDFDDRVIPHEAALEHSHISYTKGCYTGQEIVERVRARGQVNRRRTTLKFSGSTPPAADTPLNVAGKEVGRVTSAAFSPALAGPIGMGYLRREHAEPGSKLEWPGGSAEVITLPIQS